MNNTISIRPGLITFRGGAFDASPHAHHAIQVVKQENGSVMTCQIDGETITSDVVIAPDITHELRLKQGLVVLVEPQSVVGQKLMDYLGKREYRVIESSDPFSAAGCDISTGILSNAGRSDAEESQVPVPLDTRIQSLISRLDLCLQGECIKPSHWKAAEVADELAISESRFLHLFREQMGVAWRPYLLWRRLICALMAMQMGAKATDAAYRAGFSDSAHLSRSFRQNFGMSIREASRLFS
ncbi:helix-turn-helix transcriptional regulator [Hahella ganghwensis]|uniref:helix-turn-helix transcriptional regulator n=1 Tax=Hahella ganghwensis TaxID=286420 RepID=UPI000367761A|nr:helix-turn-helix transcriptional regulator [Hahella ganghwensis]